MGEREGETLNELDESIITQYHLESRVESLEQMLRDWGYDENEALWQEGVPEQGYTSQAPRERPGNKLYDESGAGVIIHELDKDGSASQSLVDATGDPTAVAATVTSQVAISASMMGQII